MGEENHFFFEKKLRSEGGIGHRPGVIRKNAVGKEGSLRDTHISVDARPAGAVVRSILPDPRKRLDPGAHGVEVRAEPEWEGGRPVRRGPRYGERQTNEWQSVTAGGAVLGPGSVVGGAKVVGREPGPRIAGVGRILRRVPASTGMGAAWG